MINELFLIVREKYEIRWRPLKIDLADLAKKRWIKKWTVKRLAEYFKKTPNAIQLEICDLRRNNKIMEIGLDQKELDLIKPELFKVFRGP